MIASLNLPPVPDRYIDALLTVRSAICRGLNDNSVFIAGGAIRDLLTGREPKDIDIFVLHFDSPFDSDIATDVNRLSILAGAKVIDDHQDDGISSKTVDSKRVYLQNDNIDVILLEKTDWNILSVLDSFDIGICKAAHTGEHYILHDHFIEDLNHEVIRVRASGAYSHESIRNRIEKLKQYYPSFSVEASFLDQPF